ncbi:hypothetical protein FACS1894200_04420 [Spirochaetia bacterium]|nr:hypothetical protein FACS1894200_04420 [Spirochaetia bacterium]
MNCANHPTMQATSLCLNCSKWFCSSCMDPSRSVPTCLQCAGAASPSGKPLLDVFTSTNAVNALGEIEKLIPKTGNIVKIGFGLSLGVFAVFTLLMHLRYGIPYLYIPLGLYAIGGFVVLKRFWGKPKSSINKSSINRSTQITLPQVDTLLKVHDNKISAKMLSSATNTTEEAAKKYLTNLVLEDKLTINSDTDELLYCKVNALV